MPVFPTLTARPMHSAHALPCGVLRCRKTMFTAPRKPTRKSGHKRAPEVSLSQLAVDTSASEPHSKSPKPSVLSSPLDSHKSSATTTAPRPVVLGEMDDSYVLVAKLQRILECALKSLETYAPSDPTWKQGFEDAGVCRTCLVLSTDCFCLSFGLVESATHLGVTLDLSTNLTTGVTLDLSTNLTTSTIAIAAAPRAVEPSRCVPPTPSAPSVPGPIGNSIVFDPAALARVPIVSDPSACVSTHVMPLTTTVVLATKPPTETKVASTTMTSTTMTRSAQPTVVASAVSCAPNSTKTTTLCPVAPDTTICRAGIIPWRWNHYTCEWNVDQASPRFYGWMLKCPSIFSARQASVRLHALIVLQGDKTSPYREEARVQWCQLSKRLSDHNRSLGIANHLVYAPVPNGGMYSSFTSHTNSRAHLLSHSVYPLL